MNSKSFAHIIALFTVTVWGFTFVGTKTLLLSFTPLQILTMRFVLGLGGLCLIRPHILKLKERWHELLFISAGLTGLVMYYLMENIALTFADASFVGVALSVAPLFTAVLAFIVLREKGIGPLFVIGFLLAIAGIAFVSIEGSAISNTYASPMGVLLCFIAALAWAVYSLVVRKLSDLGYETIASTKRTFAWGVFFMLVLTAIMREPFDASALLITQNWVYLLFLGLGASGCCFVTWGIAVARLGASMASVYIYLTPVITVMASVALLGDPFTMRIGVGVALVLVGLVVSELQGRLN